MKVVTKEVVYFFCIVLLLLLLLLLFELDGSYNGTGFLSSIFLRGGSVWSMDGFVNAVVLGPSTFFVFLLTTLVEGSTCLSNPS